MGLQIPNHSFRIVNPKERGNEVPGNNSLRQFCECREYKFIIPFQVPIDASASSVKALAQDDESILGFARRGPADITRY